MTISPYDSDLVFGVDGPKYKVGPRCANPTCRRWAADAHHMWRRSKLKRDLRDWVELEDGSIVGNLTGLCRECHMDITGDVGGHKAAIRYVDGVFVWFSVWNNYGVLEYEPLGALRPQPPTPESLTGTTPPSGDTEEELCPTCGHKKRKGPGTPGPRRLRKTWTVSVPDDDEKGAEVLDTLVDDLAIDLGYHDERSALRRYHTLVPALYWVQQNKTLFLTEMSTT